MDVKQAVSTAKGYVQYLFEDETIADLGLEEVEFDDQDKTWRITVGFSRPDFEQPPESKPIYYGRYYKIVRISDDTKQVLSIKNREPYQ
jgi:hypothetical protein